MAGWRHEHLPELPDDEPIRVVPDWICEILSPSTRSYDARVRLEPFAAAELDLAAWCCASAR